MADPLAFIDRSRPMGRAIAEFRWEDTPLGPIPGWPAALKITTGFVARSGFPKCLCWGPEMISIYNDGFRALLGEKGDCLGQPFPEIWAEAWAEIAPIAEAALAGTSTFIPDFPLVVQRGPGRGERAFFTFSYSPVVDETGQVLGFMDTVIETTKRVTRERETTIRNRELSHRMKNSFSLFSAIASQTFRESSDLEDVRTRLLGRVQVLSRAQEILSANRGAPGTLHEVMQASLAPVLPDHGARLSMEGPALPLSESQAFALSLALHELLTNAVKYGALSGDEGRIDILWDLAEDGGFRLGWTESGGPTVERPRSVGFGTFLIRDAVAAAFGGAVELDYPPAGVRFRLAAQLPEPATAAR